MMSISNEEILKPHKGTIENWAKLFCTEQGLGYVVYGNSVDHPEFGGRQIRTSWVVKHEGTEIETRNSRYTLGVPELSTPLE